MNEQRERGTTMTATKKATMTCPKCGGSGDIPAFSGIANGVCFRCAGKGIVAYRKTTRQVKPLTPYLAGIIEAITTADLSAMTYRELMNLRDAAHYPTPHCPDLLNIWRERGEVFFQESQTARLERMYS